MTGARWISKLAGVHPAARRTARRERAVVLASLEASLAGCTRPAVMLSAGADSNGLLCALLELGVKPVVYSATRADHDSTDFRVARANAARAGLVFRRVAIPVELEQIQRRVQQCLDHGLVRKCFVEPTVPLFVLYDQIKAEGCDMVVSGEFGDAYFCNTRSFVLAGHKNKPDACDEYRATHVGDAQSDAEESYCSGIDLPICFPYMDGRLLPIYQGLTWEQLNKPFDKVPRRLAWLPYYQHGIRVTPCSNLQCGDSRIRDLFPQLLDSPWNTKGRRSLVWLYRDLAAGEHRRRRPAPA